MDRESEDNPVRAWTIKKPSLKWNELDDETRSEITQQLIAANQRAFEALQPSIGALTATVLPAVLNYMDFMPALTEVAESLLKAGDLVRRWVPNWSWKTDSEKAWNIASEGIPLAFVPRAEVVDLLVAAEDNEQRREIVLSSKKLILQDCRAALVREPDDQVPKSITSLQNLLIEVFEAIEAGRPASACALGCSVIDSAIRRTHVGKTFDYSRFRAEQVKTQRQEAIAENAFRVSLALQPLRSLFEDWKPGRPPLSMPSRHAFAHWMAPELVTETDAIIVAMVASSVFEGLVERDFMNALIQRES